MTNRSLLILEIIWFSVGIICIAGAIRYGIATGGPRMFIFIIMALVSFTFAWIRHRQRKKS